MSDRKSYGSAHNVYTMRDQYDGIRIPYYFQALIDLYCFDQVPAVVLLASPRLEGSIAPLGQQSDLLPLVTFYARAKVLYLVRKRYVIG